jgi:DNA-binding CsgD family transcriptional regulator
MQTDFEVLQSQRRLQSQTLDHWRDGNDFLRATCAEMILTLGDSDRCWQVLVAAMRRYIDCDRVDAGPCQRESRTYRPVAQADRADISVNNVIGLCLPNLNPTVQGLWQSGSPLVSEFIDVDMRLDSKLRAILKASGTQGFVSFSITYDGRDVGLLCLDHIEKQTRWNEGKIAQLLHFVENKAAPILAATDTTSSIFALLTPAERKVIRATANANSYKAIARTLGKSFSTVDHQLRSIRKKLGVSSHIELIRLLQVAKIRDFQ